MAQCRTSARLMLASFILFVGVFVVCIECEEVGVDSQSVYLPANTTTSTTASNETIWEAGQGPSNKYPGLSAHADMPFAPRPPNVRGGPWYGPPHRPGPYEFGQRNPYQQQYYYYRPRIHLEPVQMDHLANASRRIVGELVSGVSEAFHSLFAQSKPRVSLGQTRMLNGDHIREAASRLLPTSTKLLARTSTPAVPLAHIEQANQHATNETFKHSNADERSLPPSADSINYDEEGQKLREDIVQKVGHLQNVLTTALEVSKERRDLITRRILEQTNYRLEQAKERADRILSEPANSQLAVRTLYAINQGINGIHSFLHGLLDRINISINVKLADPVKKEELKHNETNQTTNSDSSQDDKTKTITVTGNS